MNYKDIRYILNNFQENNYKELIKAIISIELNLEDEIKLNEIYDYYIYNDDVFLINEKIMIFGDKERL